MTRRNCFGYCSILDEDAEEKKEVLVVLEKNNLLASSSCKHKAAGLGETSTRLIPRIGNFLFACCVHKTKSDSNKEASVPEDGPITPKTKSNSNKEASVPEYGPRATIAAQTFTFQELEAVTKTFSEDCLLGGKEFGPLYKGCLENTGQVVAVRKLGSNVQNNREFLVEVLTLSLLHHPNIVRLIGYCSEGDQRLLVYEFMPLGSLEDHLHDLPSTKNPLDWNTRVKIAAGAAKSLKYLHDGANPPVIHRNFKPSSILLDEGYNPKLSGFRYAKLAPVGDKTHVSTRVMGTYGYCAPEYAMTGQLTLKCDIYSFGVVLLELITGRKTFDNTRSPGEQNLVAWARPLFQNRRKFPDMVDPLLESHYPIRGLYQVLEVAAMCLQEQAAARPDIQDVVTALSYVASQTYEPNTLKRIIVGPSMKANNQAAERSGSDVIR